MTPFTAYKHYSFRIPLRVKFFNLFRYFFSYALLEKYLVAQLSSGNSRYWHRFVPPLYFYKKDSIRIAERNHIWYRLDISMLHDHSIYFCSIKDAAWTKLFKLLRPDFNIIDVGANIGFLTLAFASRCPGGVIYSFEPDSESFQKISYNVNLNRFNNIRLFKKAIGATTGSGKLYKVYPSNPGANRILHERPTDSLPFEEVEIETLDNYEKERSFDRVDLIKIDVEGFEVFVLQGARNLIGRCRPLLFVELVDQNLRAQGHCSESLLACIKELGYSVVDAITMEPLTESGSLYTDIICFPQSK